MISVNVEILARMGGLPITGDIGAIPSAVDMDTRVEELKFPSCSGSVMN